MPSSSTARKAAGTAAGKGQVPRQRARPARQAQRPAGVAQQRAGAAQRPAGPAQRRAGAAEQRANAAQRPEAQRSGMPNPVPRIRMPGGTAGRVIWWGGLATVAALGVVDWPVVALVAAGTWVAEQHSQQAGRARAAR